VAELLTVQVKWERTPLARWCRWSSGHRTQLPADLVLLAMGFLGPEQILLAI
jgi:hypothetical protein